MRAFSVAAARLSCAELREQLVVMRVATGGTKRSLEALLKALDYENTQRRK